MGRKGSIVYSLDWQANKVLGKWVNKTINPGLQGLIFDPTSHSALVTSVGRAGVELISYGDARVQRPPAFLEGITLPEIGELSYDIPADQAAGLAISAGAGRGQRCAIIALTFADQVAVLDLRTGTILSKVKTGIAPFGVAIDAKNTTAWVSNWGGRFPRPGDLTATTGSHPNADKIVVDARGIAASGTVSRIDLTTGTVTAQIEVGLHPTSLALDDSRSRLYVANSNSDTVSVIDTETNAVAETAPLQPFTRDVVGVAPDSLVLSKDGQHLYVACAGINAVAVMDLGGPHLALTGLIPTGWYPDSIAISPDGKYLAVGTLLGVGSGWKNDATNLDGCPHGPSPDCKSTFDNRGTIDVVPVPDQMQLHRYTLAVAKNNRLNLEHGLASREQAALLVAPVPVPLQAGDPSLIRHVIYIIKENNSYDQFFGDLEKGNGDASLELYSEDVIPNHRKLARDFVLLDNFYVMGGDSAEGHQWVTQANESDYVYLPGYGGRSYPMGEDPMAGSRGGFIWNAVNGSGKSFVDFGEYTGAPMRLGLQRKELLEDFRRGSTFEGKFSNSAPNASLEQYLAKDYPGWTLDVPDVARARIFMRYLKRWEVQDDMPNLTMVQLPADHTGGTSPGFSTPKACLADNDYALGLIVDAVSHSKFWQSTLILAVEDDTSNGVDHVDGHRTVALAISPYIKRGFVDSTFYSQPSMLKTIELILGLENMSLFDLIANDMRNSFQKEPDLTPYTAREPAYSIYAVNPPLNALVGQKRFDAEASLKMNFSIPDAAPMEKLRQILWRDARGPKAPYPKVPHALFAPFSNGPDGDE
jgi:YVTN family beta-propeller protein